MKHSLQRMIFYRLYAVWIRVLQMDAACGRKVQVTAEQDVKHVLPQAHFWSAVPGYVKMVDSL
ncbi:hypothetical protein [Paenibacillus pabuli]|uniref:hypothetical protein n=2 Tax=Paenibacillus pabuli TaxID=1472 RepID=UPI002DBDC3CD|nr:hypothetical protein [Paenibacillus pabuli]MEC0124021.1 hypothetical protein [Paenibacillus pabuli]